MINQIWLVIQSNVWAVVKAVLRTVGGSGAESGPWSREREGLLRNFYA
jgi:hypothetical protein